jgi:haloalkane dehalogenase
METVRTPDERFEGLDGYSFEPNYVEIPDGDGGSLRVHYVDEGPSDAPPVLLLHGEPTWSYLYRKMIPGLAAAGHRVIAPDLVGFGKSDKPTKKSDFTFARHLDWMSATIEALDLRGITLFCQDWGSLIGITVATGLPDRFDGIVAANAGLPDAANPQRMMEAQLASGHDTTVFQRWQAYAASVDELDISGVITGSIAEQEGVMISPTELTDAERAAYDAPFPDASYQAGALVFPALVGPQSAEDKPLQLMAEAWRVLEKWEKPFLCAYGKADPVLGWFDEPFKQYVPGAAGLPHVEFADGGHFIQEQKPDELVMAIDGLIATT